MDLVECFGFSIRVVMMCLDIVCVVAYGCVCVRIVLRMCVRMVRSFIVCVCVCVYDTISGA